MLGRKKKTPSIAASAATSSREGVNGAAKKRKWQEEQQSDDSDNEGKITKADLDAWKKTIEEEEKEEEIKREKEERLAEQAEKRRRQADEVEQRRKQEEEAHALKDAEEARKSAEDAEVERRRQEAATSFIGAGPLPMDVPSVLPAGVRPGKEHLYKTMYCKRWEQGNCQFGGACHFAHGERELRGRPPKGSMAGTLSVALPEGKPMLGKVGMPGLPAPPPPAVLPMGALAPGLATPPQTPAQAAATLGFINTLLANAKAAAGGGGVCAAGGCADAGAAGLGLCCPPAAAGHGAAPGSEFATPLPVVPRVIPPPVQWPPAPG